MIFSDKTTWMYLLILAIIGWLISLLAPILAPFLIAAFLAYVGDPIVDWFETKKLKRTTGVSIVFLVMTLFSIAVLIILTPLIESQIRTFIVGLPKLLHSLNSSFIPFLESYIGTDIPELNTESVASAAKEHWNEVGGILGIAAGWLGNSTQLLLALLASATIVPVVTFYLLRDWDILVARIRELIPRKFLPRVESLAKESDEVLSEFLRGQLLLMLAQAIYFSVALALVGLDLALLIGLIAGGVSFVPYLGLVIGLGAGVLAAFLQFQEILPMVLVCAVFGIGQILEGVVLQPLLIGERIGLHPVAVIFAVMAGGQLFGFVGVLIALPVAAVITVMLRHLHEVYVRSELYDVVISDDELPKS